MPAVRRSLACAVIIAFGALIPAEAHPERGHESIQNRTLFAAVVHLGGGPQDFRAGVLRRALAATRRGEEAALQAELGAAEIARFDRVFTVVVNGVLAEMKKSGDTLPPPSPRAAAAVAQALVHTAQFDGRFDVEHLFDVLFSPSFHDRVMVDAAAAYGAAGDEAYHHVFGRLVRDLGQRRG